MNIKCLSTLIIILFILAGCAPPKATDTSSGFLTDYFKLQPEGKNSAAYYAEGYDPKNYGKVEFEPVVVHLSPHLLNNTTLQPAQQQEISQYVADQLNQKLVGGFHCQGQGTLKIRSAVSGVSKTTQELSAWQYLPVTLVATAAMEATGQRGKAMVLFFEAEAKDLASGEIMVAKVRAAELGSVDNADFEKDPIGTMKPLIDKWIDQLISDIEKQLQ